MNSNLIIYSDRCTGTAFPDNTIEAMRILSERGVKNISISVQANSNNELIVFHDESLTRLTTNDGYVRHYDNESLSNVTLKSAFGHPEIKIPSLAAFMNSLLAQESKFNLCIEMRGVNIYRILVDELIKFNDVIECGLLGLTIASKDHNSLVMINSLLPVATTMAIVCGTPLTYTEDIARAGIDKIKIECSFINSLLINDANARGVGVFIGGVKDKTDFLKLEDYDIEGVFTLNGVYV